MDARDAALLELSESREAYYRVSQARSAAHNQLVELQGNIRVMCRVRPPLRSDGGSAAASAVACASSSDLIVRDSGRRTQFGFDQVFTTPLLCDTHYSSTV